MNRKIKLFLYLCGTLAVSVVLCASPAASQSTRLIYEEATGNKIDKIEFLFEQGASGCSLTIARGNKRTQVWGDENLYTTAVRHFDLDGGNDVFIERKDNIIRFAGRLEGKDIDKTIKIEKTKWCGATFMQKGFVLSGKKSEEFLVALPSDQSALKMMATREKEEEIVICGKRVMAAKIRLNVADWRSVFWKSYYWFRVLDGIFLKSEEVRGIPGTPMTTVELIGEEVANK